MLRIIQHKVDHCCLTISENQNTISHIKIECGMSNNDWLSQFRHGMSWHMLGNHLCSCCSAGCRFAQHMFMLCFSSIFYFIGMAVFVDEISSGRAVLCQHFPGGHVYFQSSKRPLMCLYNVYFAIHASIFKQKVA